jgi:hypothetical protein
LIAHNHNRIVRMKPTPALMSIAASFTLGIRVAAAQQPAAPSPLPLPPPPSWAYGFAGAADPNATPPAQGRGGGRGATQQAAPDTTKRTLAGSSASFTLAQVRDGFGPADWFPNDHPPMPPIVAQGRRDAMITAYPMSTS